MQSIRRLKHNKLDVFYRCTRPCSTISTKAIEEPVENLTDEIVEVQGINRTLNSKHRIIAEGGIPPVTYETEKHKWAMQERFGQYGLKSGVDVRMLWPTIEEIEEINALRLYRKANDAIEIANTKKSMKEKAQAKKLADMEKKLAAYPAKLRDYEKAVKEKDVQIEKIQSKKQIKILEIQEHFGFWIDKDDPRFDALVKQKEAEDKKKARENRKLKKAGFMLGLENVQDTQSKDPSDQVSQPVNSISTTNKKDNN